MIKNIFFDLDGTLLGMDPEQFMQAYIRSLTEKLTAAGYDGKMLVDAVMKGTLAMLAGDGSAANDRVFWDKFCALTGLTEENMKPVMTEYYRAEFDAARAGTSRFAESEQIVNALRNKGYRLFLTTNAVFPREAIETRCAWAGLTIDAFEYVTLYDNSRYCKPNPLYFKDIFDRFGLNPAETLLIGNDREEDCAVETWGATCVLTSENLINRKNLPIDGRRVLTHAELLRYAEDLPSLI